MQAPKPHPLDKAPDMSERDKETLVRTCLAPHEEYLEEELDPESNDTRAAFVRLVGCIEEYMKRRCVGAGVPNGKPGRAEARQECRGDRAAESPRR